jgi:drug/metabolite transporter (DMT)-like permease
MGEIAALATSFCWSFTSIQFTLAGQRVGSEVVNRTRLILAVLYLSLTHWLLYGEVWPIHAEPFRWWWLGLSGTLGLVLGDSCLFQAFLLIGTRRAMLFVTLTPIISTLVAWGWLGETLYPAEMGAVLLTVGGIAWVMLERQQEQEASVESKKQYALGVLLSLGGTLAGALGLVAAKQGLAGDFPSLSATLIRMVVAMGVIWLLTLARGQVGVTWAAQRDKEARLFIARGALTGPFIGVWLSMVAVQRAHVGIASTLISLGPIIVIPMAHWVFHEQVSPRAVAGTVVALVGATIIFLT